LLNHLYVTLCVGLLLLPFRFDLVVDRLDALPFDWIGARCPYGVTLRLPVARLRGWIWLPRCCPFATLYVWTPRGSWTRFDLRYVVIYVGWLPLRAHTCVPFAPRAFSGYLPVAAFALRCLHVPLRWVIGCYVTLNCWNVALALFCILDPHYPALPRFAATLLVTFDLRYTRIVPSRVGAPPITLICPLIYPIVLARVVGPAGCRYVAQFTRCL